MGLRLSALAHQGLFPCACRLFAWAQVSSRLRTMVYSLTYWVLFPRAQELVRLRISLYSLAHRGISASALCDVLQRIQVYSLAYKGLFASEQVIVPMGTGGCSPAYWGYVCVILVSFYSDGNYFSYAYNSYQMLIQQFSRKNFATTYQIKSTTYGLVTTNG